MGTSSPACGQSEITCAYALLALDPAEMAGAAAHIAACPACQGELESFGPILDRFVAWPADVLSPSSAVAARLASRLAAETGQEAAITQTPPWPEPEWQEVAPGIACKLLAADTGRERVSMLVRLAPGAHYPAHTHAGSEELHLLDGELWIDARKLVAGDYNYGAPGAVDERVWSETGCTCLLVTGTADLLR